MPAVTGQADIEPDFNLDDIPDWEHKRYTKTPNVYLDEIIEKLGLTAVQQVMIQLVWRLTLGYHEKVAAISNPDFARSAFVSVRTIQNAKKYLLETGLLVEVRRGSGKKKGVYWINLDYDKEPISEEAKKPIIRIVKAAYPGYECHLSTLPHDSRLPELKVYKRRSANEESATETDPADLPAMQQLPAAAIGIQEIPEQTQTPSDLEPTDDPPSEETPAKPIESGIESRGAKRSPLASMNMVPWDPDLRKKQTATERKKNYDAVCQHFKILGIALTPKDRQFVRWAIGKYGAIAVIEKLKIMRFQRSRGVKFTNPLGWLNSALQRDYQPSERDQKKAKADKFFKDEAKRNCEKQKQTEQRSAREQKENADFAAVKSKMESGARTKLREKATSEIRETPGMVPGFMNPIVIDLKENEILRRDLAS